MKPFWYYFRQVLRHRTALGVSVIAALVDAVCMGGGFSAIMVLIDQLFMGDQNFRQKMADRLADPQVADHLFPQDPAMAQALTERLGQPDITQALLIEPATVQSLVRDKLQDPRLIDWVGDHTQLANWVPAGKFEGFAFVLGVIFLLVLVGSTARFIQQSTIISVIIRTTARIRQQAFARLLHTPLELVLAMGTSDNMTRIARDTSSLGRGFNALLGKAVRDVLMGLVLLMIALIQDWKLTLLFLITIPLIVTLITKFGRKLRRAAKYAMRAYGGLIAAMLESLRGLRVVKVHNAEGYERRRFAKINRTVLRQELRARTIRALSSPAIETLAITAVMGVALVAGHYAFNLEGTDPANVAKVLLLLAASGTVLKPLANLNNDIQEAAAAAIRLDEILHYPAERHARHGDKDLIPLPRHHDRVVFEQATYRYPGAADDSLRGVSLDVPFGTTVAVVGPNGSGKSTLLALIPHLLVPAAGRVLIDGVDLNDVSLRSLRKQLAVVTQDTVLFGGTIAHNIAYGQLGATPQQIETAARAAHAWEFISELPDRLDHVLAEGGEGLSGGQKQRICIARAILRDPAILILDEATSQIDADSEAKINQAMRQISIGRTTFIIAHRLSTVVDADMIVVMDDGRVLDTGTHHELIGRCGVYQMLARTQLGS